MNNSNKKWILTLILLSCSFLGTDTLVAQLFKGGVVSGISFSQIEGDDIKGYHKVGFNGGFKVDIFLKETLSATMEILYAQRGSAAGSLERANGFAFKYKWDYVEIPILVHYRDQNGMDFGGGIVPARLIRAAFFDAEGVEDIFYFDNNSPAKWDFSLAGDLVYHITPQLFVNVRGIFSIIPNRDVINQAGNVTGQFHNVLSIRAGFMFGAVENKKRR